MTTRFPFPVTKLKANVKYRRRKLYRMSHSVDEFRLRNNPAMTTSHGRLMVIQRLVTKLFKEERIETDRESADECRHYAERLIHLAIQYGDRHKPTMEIANYYLNEKDLIRKLFCVFVPRFQNCLMAYTRVFALPSEYIPGIWIPFQKGPKHWRLKEKCVLELRGNPYPPVVTVPERHSNSILNILLDSARERYLKSKYSIQANGDQMLSHNHEKHNEMVSELAEIIESTNIGELSSEAKNDKV